MLTAPKGRRGETRKRAGWRRKKDHAGDRGGDGDCRKEVDRGGQIE